MESRHRADAGAGAPTQRSPLGDPVTNAGGSSDGDSGSPPAAAGDRPRSDSPHSLDRLVPLVYAELRAIAHRELARRGAGGASEATLATTGLVNEAYLKLADGCGAGWRDRAHFLAIASVAMRHILVDRAKARVSLKRGGGWAPVTLEDALADPLGGEDPEALLQLDDALDRLAALDERLARVVECRFFGGLTEEETSEALGITTRTVQRDWGKARMLLRRLLGAAREPDA